MRALLEIYCDGGCKVGTGKGAATYLFVKDGVIQFIHSTPIIKEGLTNNRAEYLAMMLALCDSPFEASTVMSDSEVVVKQLNGQYEVKDAKLKEYNDSIKRMICIIKETVTVKHVPRENKYIQICDKMNKTMMEMI